MIRDTFPSPEGGDSTNEKLLGRAHLFEMVVRHAHDAIIIMEANPADPPHPRIIYVNAAFEMRSGYRASDVIGKSPTIFHGAGTDAATIRKIDAALATRQPIEIEFQNYRKDGTPYWVEISLVPVADELGSNTYWFSVRRDVTERKVIAESLTQARVAEAQATTYANELRQRRQLEEQLALSVTHDDVTGLRNRRFFMRALQDAVARTSSEKGLQFSLASINVDRFRVLNASFGNRVGNTVLREVAKRLKQYADDSAIVARIAGDEYAILMEGSDAALAHTRAEALLGAFRDAIDISGDEVRVSLSVGITDFAADDREAETLLRDAGIAMNRAKREGGNRIAIFTPSMEAEASDALRINSDLRRALDRREFRLHYQPIVDASGGRVAGFEALIRWVHPTRGMIPPLQFIPAAEEAGLIIPIGAWVLEQACTAAEGWQALGADPLTISVNVTSQQLLSEQFVDHLKEVLARTCLQPELLQLEVTESVLLAGAAIVEPLFKSIRGLGVKIAFDDFGTGYSSLSYLERFQIDTLKIDKSFVDRMNDTSAKSEIIRMIIALAHSLGVKVIAEGIELQTQCDALSQLGCTDMQGYLFSRPIPEDEIPAQITSNWESKTQLRELLDGTSNRFRYTKLTTEQRLVLEDQVKAAIRMHKTWLDRLKDAADTGRSEYSVATVARDDICPIGIWLSETIAPELRESPLHVITVARHAVFHRSAARLLSLALAGDPSVAASFERGGDFQMVDSLMLNALEDWLLLASQGT
jgi:diguanylate cyclase (GGDEF)-like protein/PAS domain S-box-containing protein